ncbi:MAG: VCBS repeat-containing protein [SAR324 cluster bacterium]|nr:VCBS repeat-containing protein [SAR324 cluster bacterium]
MLSLLLPASTPWAQQSQVGIRHTWTRVYYGELDGKERLLFGGGFERAKPALGDLDGDGDLDLLLGTATGRVLYFENQGSAGKPLWRLVSEGLRAADPGAAPGRARARRIVDVGSNAAPTLVDIDSDDDLDLIVGAASGKLHLYLNTGNRYLPSFQLESSDFLTADFGRNLVPAFGDVNRDGLPDLALGNAEGVFSLLLNQGSRFSPRYCTKPRAAPPHCLHPARELGRLQPDDNAVPNWVDWDGDGDLDLMIGKSDGKIAFYRNIGDARRGVWELAQPRFMILDAGGYAAPLFRDVTGDGRPDLLLAGDGDRVAFYANQPGPRGADLWLEDKNILQIVRLGQFQSRLHTASGDLNGDGRPDLVIGTRGGRLLVYENVGDKGKIAFRSTDGPLLPTPKRAFSVPALADLDGDKDLDLIVGNRNGRLEYIENVGTLKEARWKLRDLFFGQIDVGAMSSPVFYDFDRDGDLDLLVGNSIGNAVYYTNRGTRAKSDLVLQAIRFAGMQVLGGAAPALFSYNQQAPPDLVLGGRSGRLVSAVRDPGAAITAPRAYLAQRTPWQRIESHSYSAPHFVDLSGDGQQDLLLGGGNGILALWRYEGSRRPLIAKAGPRRPDNMIEQRSGLAAQLSAHSPSAVARPQGGQPPASPETGFTGDRLAGGALDPIFEAVTADISALTPGRSSRPAFIDVNGDRQLDLIVGNRAGQLLLYRNLGPGSGPRWEKVSDNFAGYHHGRNASPVFFDLDHDGDQDLAVGTETGRVFYWENTGGPDVPQWRHRPRVFGRVRAGKNAVPAFADLDGDGLSDLLAGSLRGRLSYYRRQPGAELRFKLVDRRYYGLDVGVNASPSLNVLPGGKQPVLLVGSDRGHITVMVPAQGGPPHTLGWKIEKSFLEGLAMPAGSHPALADLDGDGDLDLFVGSDTGSIRFFRNNARVGGRTGREVALD